MASLDRWLTSWKGVGVGASPPLASLLHELKTRYAEPARRYHTLQHLDECFARLGELYELAAHPAEVELALWFHDAIYDPRRADNEERSADWARGCALDQGVDDAAAQRIHGLVMATRHAAQPEGVDAEVLVDVDLAILGASPARFDEYERQIREEYAFVAEAAFRNARRLVIGEFLARETIYCTKPFRDHYEAAARANLRRSLARLESVA